MKNRREFVAATTALTIAPLVGVPIKSQTASAEIEKDIEYVESKYSALIEFTASMRVGSCYFENVRETFVKGKRQGEQETFEKEVKQLKEEFIYKITEVVKDATVYYRERHKDVDLSKDETFQFFIKDIIFRYSKTLVI